MAKLALINREQKRADLVKKYAGKRGLPKASEGYDDEEDEAEEVTPAKRRTTKPKLAGERPTKAAAPAKKAPAKKPATKRATGAGKTATKTAAKTATKTAAKRAPAKKRAA